MKKVIALLLKTSIIFLFACNTPVKNNSEWQVASQVKKTVGNISFTFPSKGYAYDHRDKLVEECLAAIKSNIALIDLRKYDDTIKVQFLRSRQEMKEHTGITPSGVAIVQSKILYVVANGEPNEVKPPVKHELMHMISMTTWGYPGQDSNWMNEGLAALAENNCNGYNDEQIYQYLSDRNMLIPMDDLAKDFYKQPEMIAYHQAGYIVQYLLSNYGVEKFRTLWTQGFASFENIYGLSFSSVTTDIGKTAKQAYPSTPAIDWNTFKEGCL